MLERVILEFCETVHESIFRKDAKVAEISHKNLKNSKFSRILRGGKGIGFKSLLRGRILQIPLVT